MAGEVRCIDSDDNLELWSYTNCTNESDEEIKKCRGQIRDREDGHIVCASFGYTDEYICNNMDNVKPEEWRWFYSVEGTMLRLFHFKEKWYLCTHRRLDAFKSRWSCRQTFGDIFIEYLHEIYGDETDVMTYLTSRLDKGRVYFFMLKSNYQNRIVCHYRTRRLLLIGSYDTSLEVFVFHTSSEDDDDMLSKIPGPQPFDETDDLENKIMAMNIYEYQGIIGFKKGRTIKVLHPDYKRLYDIRGNNPNLRFRYLEIRNEPDKVESLYTLYPRFSNIFDEYENILLSISQMIHKFYVKRYIHKMYITLPPEEYSVMKKCHQWFLEDRSNHRVFTKKVFQMMNDEPALNLYKMIQRYQQQVQPVNRRPVYPSFPPRQETSLAQIHFPPLDYERWIE